MELWVEDGKGTHRVVAPSDWLTIDGEELILRLSGRDGETKRRAKNIATLLRAVHDSERQIIGRAAIFHPIVAEGVVAVGGFRASGLRGVAGILLGATDRITRDQAAPLANASSLRAWASEQASLIANTIGDPEERLICATGVIAYGGDPGVLPIAIRGDDLVNFETLSRWSDAPDEVALYRISYDEMVDEEIRLNPDVLGISELIFGRPGTRRSVVDWIVKALAKAWSCEYEKVEVLKSLGSYEIGFKEGNPMEEWNVTLLRRPSA